MDANFKISLQIVDVPSLIAAAIARAIEDGIDEDEASQDLNADNLDRCLVMLLDPGSLAGCKVYASAAEVQLEA